MISAATVAAAHVIFVQLITVGSKPVQFLFIIGVVVVVGIILSIIARNIIIIAGAGMSVVNDRTLSRWLFHILVGCRHNACKINKTKEHWIQHNTITAEINAADTHTHTHTHSMTPSITIPSLLVKW